MSAAAFSGLTLASISKTQIRMNQQEIIETINRVPNLKGMTVNEMLYATGLDNEFYTSLESDKINAEIILILLNVGKHSIENILKNKK